VKQAWLVKFIGTLTVLAVTGWVVWKWRSPATAEKVILVSKASNAPLYEAHDKPATIVLKAVEMESGRPANITATIRQSKSRYNQMKQAVLAFLRGPKTGKFQVPVPEGMELNEFYFTPLGVAVVDLSVNQAKAGSLGFYEETLLIKGLIEVLSRNFFEVKQVKVLVDGQDAPTLMGHYALGTNESSGPVSAAENAPVN